MSSKLNPDNNPVGDFASANCVQIDDSEMTYGNYCNLLEQQKPAVAKVGTPLSG